ncbi:MAG: sulfatase-like hydrolase/transferase [Planctomycetota bacterium]
MPKLLACCLLAMLSLVCPQGYAAVPDRPNILFIFADDHAYDCIAAHGNDQIKTPTLDELAHGGTTFTHAYNMGSYSGAVCIASRMMLNSGRFVWTSEKLHKRGEQERQAGRWWPEYMEAAGYETYMTGKWHLAASAEESFAHVKNKRPGMPRDTKEGYNRPKPGGSDPWDPADPKFGGFWAGGKHWSEVIADDTAAFLEHAKDLDKPFFMYVAFNAPHDPRQAPQKYIDLYPSEDIKIPQPFIEQYPYGEAMQCPPGLRDERLAPHPRFEHAIRVNRAEYYAIITHMDTQIGRIMAALEKTGKADNTIVIFTADHGLAVGHHGLLGKQNMYDHSVRVPFILKGPGIASGKEISKGIYLQDIMPTTLEWAGIKDKPNHIDFKSLNPLLKDDTAKHYPAIYGGYREGQRAITHDGYKLILYPKVPIARLYHLAKDPEETTDFADKPASKPIMKKLFAKLLELQVDVRDELDLKAIYPELAE